MHVGGGRAGQPGRARAPPVLDRGVRRLAVGWSSSPTSEMVELVRDLRGAGLRTGLLTNNVRSCASAGGRCSPSTELFDDVVDSHEVGHAQAQPGDLPPGPRAARRLRRPAPRSWTTSPATWPAAEPVGMIGVLVGARRPGRHRARCGELAGARLGRPVRAHGVAAAAMQWTSGAPAGSQRRLGRPQGGAGGDDVVDHEHRALTRRRATNDGPARRSSRVRPVWGRPSSSTRASSRRHGTPSRQATARASTSAWS